MESFALVGIITGLSGLVVAILTHIKHSNCLKGLIEFDTREIANENHTVNEHVHPTPILEVKNRENNTQNCVATAEPKETQI